MRIGVIGSRSFPDDGFARRYVEAQLDDLVAPHDEVASGECPEGVDAWVKDYTSRRGVEYKPFPPDLERYGSPRAYHIRNDRIIGYVDVVVAFWNGKSPGTSSVVRKCKKRGRRMLVFFIGADRGWLMSGSPSPKAFMLHNVA